MKRILLFCLFICSTVCFAQQDVYYYTWKVKNVMREGVLVYNEKENNAMYWDLLDTQKQIEAYKTTFQGEKRTVYYSKSKLDIYFKEGDKLTFTEDIAGRLYYITDATLQMKWKLENETQKIGDFICNKATINFRGREWTIWYTTDIPVSYGPWKFYGLPGLVVKAEDSSQQFSFHLNRIERKTESYKNIPLNLADYNSISLKEFDQFKNEFVENSMESLGLSPVNNNEKRNGMEIIYEWESAK